MRSDEFKAQLEALRLGATIAHISPASLLSDVQIPVLPLDDQEQKIREYEVLCELEATIEDAQARAENIRTNLWSTHG